MNLAVLPGIWQSLTIVHVQTRMNKAGGAEENTWASCMHQMRSGHDVHLVCGASSDVDHYRNRCPDITIHLVPEMVWDVQLRADYAACAKLKTLFEAISPDVVHTHSSKAGILGRIAAKLAKVPFIVHGVHILPFSNVSLAEKITYLAAEHFAALMTDHFVHVSEGTKRAYQQAWVGRRKPHSVVRSGMDIAKFRSPELPHDWRSILGVSEGEARPVTVLMMAVLEARKRQAEFLQEFGRITHKGEPIRVLLAGDGPERAHLVEIIEQFEMSDRVKLLGYRRDPEKLLALSDFSALASFREGLPRTIVQSLAAGRPAIVSPFRGIEEIITTGMNGIVVDTRDAESVARGAVALARDSKRLAELTKGAAAAPVNEWTFESMFSQLDTAYARSLATLAIAKKVRRNTKPNASGARPVSEMLPATVPEEARVLNQ